MVNTFPTWACSSSDLPYFESRSDDRRVFRDPRVFHEIANEVPSNSSRHSKSKHTPFHGANISTFLRANLPRYLRGSLLFYCADHFASHSVLRHSFSTWRMFNSWLTCAADKFIFKLRICLLLNIYTLFHWVFLCKDALTIFLY